MRRFLWSVLVLSALTVACADPIEPPRMPPNEDEEQPDPNDNSEGISLLLGSPILA